MADLAESAEGARSGVEGEGCGRAGGGGRVRRGRARPLEGEAVAEVGITALTNEL